MDKIAVPRVLYKLESYTMFSLLREQHKCFFLILFIYLFLYSRFLLVIYFIHIIMYICQSQSPNSSHHHHHHPAAFPPLVSISLFSTSMSQLLPCKPVHLYHFSRFHIYALIYDICFFLSDLLHSV